MVINFDQTGTKMVPVTLEVHGSKQIDMVGLDKISLTGELLPPFMLGKLLGVTQMWASHPAGTLHIPKLIGPQKKQCSST